MYLHPTFYFRPLPSTIILSHHFNITIRNPHPSEFDIFKQNIEILCNRLSDKEKRRILYTLYPLGNHNIQGSLKEQFINELTKIWVLIECPTTLPFEHGLIDYGFLCGFFIDNTYLQNPGGFVCDILNLDPSELLRALKTELPKAAQQLLTPSITIKDITELQHHAAYWDGIFSRPHQLASCIQLAKTLRNAHHSKDRIQKLLQYCIATEILLVNNPSISKNKTPMSQQFINKLLLIRRIMITLKQQKPLYNMTTLHSIFTQIYELRSEVVHGRQNKTYTKKSIAQFTNILFPTIRLAIELQMKDPEFAEFIKRL